MRILAIDPGAKRIGLALGDVQAKLATPYDVLEATGPEALTRLLRVIDSEGAELLVVGLPLNMDGSTGPAARQAIDFGKTLSQRSGRPVLFVDERLSTFDAEQQLVQRKREGEKITRKQKKERLDALAAASFLQAYLDGQLPAISGAD